MIFKGKTAEMMMRARIKRIHNPNFVLFRAEIRAQ